MKIVITQPNYLPWLGYFAQLNSCDLYVALDDVQYLRREWQNRNRILDVSGKARFISVPIEKSDRSTLISQVLISKSFQPRQHLERLKSYYARTPFFDDVFPFVENTINTAYQLSGGYLARLNLLIISRVCSYLNISCNFECSSSLALPFNARSATERLLQIAKNFNATSYLSSMGAKEYMQPELYLFKESSIDVLWQDFEHAPYSQHRSQERFTSHLSFLDYLFNCGFDQFTAYLSQCHREVK